MSEGIKQTVGKLSVVGAEVQGFVTENVSCDTYGAQFIKFKGLGEGQQELIIDLVSQDFQAGKPYKFDGSNQSSASYMNSEGSVWSVRSGELTLTVLDLEAGIVELKFDFNASGQPPPQEKNIRGEGKFKGITPHK